MKKLLLIFISLILIALSTTSQAENLLQVYKQAYLSSPELRKSAADRDLAFEKINEARSSLLPQLGLDVYYTYSDSYRNANSTVISTSLQLTQTLLDMSKWHMMTLQEKTANIQDVAYQYSKQMLIFNTAQAYLKVLSAIDVLSCIQVEKQTIYRHLDQVTQRFNVSLAAITDVHNARVRYDNALVNEITARNNLDNALEELNQITGNYYIKLSSLNISKFKIYELQSVNALLRQAENCNLTLLQARMNMELAREQIRQAQDSHMPTLNLIISTNTSNTNWYKNDNTHNSNTGQNKVGINFSLPIYQGGIVNSQIKQAQDKFIGASEQLEIVHRNVIQTVRSSFNNVNAFISSIHSYKLAVFSAQNSLDTVKDGYSNGVHTVTDVLDATTSLCEAKKQLLRAYYAYLSHLIKIKFAIGSLNENDLLMLNNVLDKLVSTAPNK